jgi:hypothetical protein
LGFFFGALKFFAPGLLSKLSLDERNVFEP